MITTNAAAPRFPSHGLRRRMGTAICFLALFGLYAVNGKALSGVAKEKALRLISSAPFPKTSSDALRILGLPLHGYNRKDVQKSYKKLSLITHPDKGGNEEDSKKVSKAKEILIEELELPKGTLDERFRDTYSRFTGKTWDPPPTGGHGPRSRPQSKPTYESRSSYSRPPPQAHPRHTPREEEKSGPVPALIKLIQETRKDDLPAKFDLNLNMSVDSLKAKSDKIMFEFNAEFGIDYPDEKAKLDSALDKIVREARSRAYKKADATKKTTGGATRDRRRGSPQSGARSGGAWESTGAKARSGRNPEFADKMGEVVDFYSVLQELGLDPHGDLEHLRDSTNRKLNDIRINHSKLLERIKDSIRNVSNDREAIDKIRAIKDPYRLASHFGLDPRSRSYPEDVRREMGNFGRKYEKHFPSVVAYVKERLTKLKS